MEEETQAPVKIVERLVDAANARDWDALISVCAPDVTLIHPLHDRPYGGYEGVREFFVLSSDEAPDQFLHVDVLMRSGDVVALEGRITATIGDDPVVTPCAFFFTLRRERVHQIRMYYDTAAFYTEEDESFAE